MNKNELYDAVSGINKEYIEASDDFEAVAADFRREKNRRIKTAASVWGIVLLCAGVIGISKGGIHKNDLRTPEGNEIVLNSEAAGTEVSRPLTDPFQDSSEQPEYFEDEDNTETELYYSKLVPNTDVPALEGYNDISYELSIVAFNELMIRDSKAIVEGEILDMWVNNYEYYTASDKFEENGRLHHKDTTVAFKMKIDNVLHGDFKSGDIITIEDYYFPLDTVTSVKTGGRYVIPVGEGNGSIAYEEVLSGNVEPESNLCTIYNFHPQIEKVNGGYIVPDDWKTLITEECTEIIMDIGNEEFRYPAKLYFVPDDIFRDRMEMVIRDSDIE